LYTVGKNVQKMFSSVVSCMGSV